MIEQISSITDQTPKRRPRLAVYLKFGRGPTPEDFANLDDSDVGFLEKRWGRSIATEDDLVVFQIFLTFDPEESLRQRKEIETWKSGQEYPWFASDRTMKEFLSKPLPEKTQQVVSKFRDLLRQAWRGDSAAVRRIQTLAQVSSKIVAIENGQIELILDDFLGTACMLFLRDFAASRVGICANPQCPSPFFVRSRRTQKFCDVPACMVYSHRLSANNYWSRRREKEGAKSKKRMR
jgi:hypothetical protein